MKGHVKIFTEVGGEEILIHEDHNLIVDGAGESVVDMLTFSPGFALSSNEVDSGDNTIIESALDVSNFTVQGMTFAKGELGYKSNLHTYKKHNLIPSANNLSAIVDTTNATVSALSGVHIVDYSSTVWEVSSTGDTGGFITFKPTDCFDQDYIHSLSALPKVFSIDVKMDLNDPPNANLNSGSPTYHFMTVEASSSGAVSSVTTAWVNPQRSTTVQNAGDLYQIFPDRYTTTQPTNVNPNSLFKDLGAGWYRLLLVVPEDSNYDSTEDFTITIYPCGSTRYNLPSQFNQDKLTGKMLFARPSLNVGSLPVNYFLGSEDKTTSSTDFGSGFQYTPSSIISKETGYYVPNNVGTITNSTAGYNVKASLPAMPSPDDIYLEPNSSTAYQDAVDVSLPTGHNLNTLQLVGKTDKLYFDLVPSSWTYYADYVSVLPNNGFSSLEIQKDFRWFGCFADEDDHTANLVDRIQESSYNAPLATLTSTATNRFNNVSSMDYKGYLRAYYLSRGESTDNTSKLLVSALPDFSSTGQVTYSVRITSDDLEMANYFGGIFDLGLYTMDSAKTRRKNNLNLTRSINKDAWDGDDLEFRLFAQKTMNYDITHRNSFTSASPLYIHWTIDFL